MLCILFIIYTYSLSSYGPVTLHKANSEYVITVYSNSSTNQMKTNIAAFNASSNTSMYQGELTLRLGRTSYQPIGFAFSESFSMFLTTNGSSSLYDIWIGTTGPTSLYGRSRSQPSAIAIRDYSSELAKIYYSVSCGGDICLNTEVVDVNYTISSSENYTIGSRNCANLIEVNDKIVAISCTTSTYGILSIYRESDMALYKEIEGNNSFAGIASQIALISSGYYHQVYFNSFDSAS